MNRKTRSARRVAKAPVVVAEGPGAEPKKKSRDVDALSLFARLNRETIGSMYVEYVSILCLVCLGGSVAVVSLGAPMVHYYRVAQLVIGLPVP